MVKQILQPTYRTSIKGKWKELSKVLMGPCGVHLVSKFDLRHSPHEKSLCNFHWEASTGSSAELLQKFSGSLCIPKMPFKLGKLHETFTWKLQLPLWKFRETSTWKVQLPLLASAALLAPDFKCSTASSAKVQYVYTVRTQITINYNQHLFLVCNCCLSIMIAISLSPQVCKPWISCAN
jgi:hypothetical protein